MSDKDNAVQQAQIWAQEARTQRAIVLSILRYFGLPERDYEALTLIRQKVEALAAEWDECHYDAPGGEIEIGPAIRRSLIAETGGGGENGRTSGGEGMEPWSIEVHYSKGKRTLRAGMKWRDCITGSIWEVVEPEGGRIYSPSGFGGTPTFWCRPVQKTEAAQPWLKDARADGCVSFCGDSIAAQIIDADGVALGDGGQG